MSFPHQRLRLGNEGRRAAGRARCHPFPAGMRRVQVELRQHSCRLLPTSTVLPGAPGLQGLLTNDVEALAAPGAHPVYACVLNSQGRFLHDLFLHRTNNGQSLPIESCWCCAISMILMQTFHAAPAGDEVEILADTDRTSLQDLLKLLQRWTESSDRRIGRVLQWDLEGRQVRLKRLPSWYCRYKLRARVDVADVTAEYNVWVHFGAQLQPDDLSRAPRASPLMRIRMHVNRKTHANAWCAVACSTLW